MKLPLPLAILALTFLVSCQKDALLENTSDDTFPDALTDKPALLKVSFTEETHRKAEFPEGAAEKYGMTYLEEPKSERKHIYIEVYNDFTYSKQVEYVPTTSDFPADGWSLPEDMPKVRKFTYVNGIVTGYDAKQNVIYEDTYEPSYWLDANAFDSAEEAKAFAVATYYNPSSIAKKAIAMAKAGTDSYSELSDQAIVFTQALDVPTQNGPAVARREAANGKGLEVSSEKLYMLPEYGVVYRTEGYTANGDLKDLEHNFYAFNEDSALCLTSSHYRNEQYSSAYDITFIEHSDIFYSNFVIKTSI